VAGGATSTAATEIANVSLWNGSTQIGSQTVPYTSGNFAVADFNTTMNDFVVPKDGSADLMVKVSYNTISAGARAGIKLTASVDGSTANFQFRGVNSQTIVTKANSNGLDVSGNPVVLFKTIPTLTLGTLPTAVLAAGNQVLARIVVAADAKGNVDWTQLIFTYSTSNATASNFTLVDEGNNSVGNCTDVTGTVTCTSSADNTISAGTSKTYSFKADLTVGTNSASVSTHIARANVFADPTTNASVATTSNFIWSDEAVVAHDIATSGDYQSDYLVSHLPLDSQTLSK